jgi:hypothetical protein
MRYSMRCCAVLVGCILISGSYGQSQCPRSQEPKPRHRLSRHFSDSPPLRFELESTAERGPRFILTNVYQEPLTAFIVQVEPLSERDKTSIIPWDAFDGGQSPVPRGLSIVQGVPHIVGGRIPDAKLVAAVWDDGSTFGPDELVQTIFANRRILADAFDRAIRTLQTGLEQNWSREQYIAAVEREKGSVAGRDGLTGEAYRAATISIFTITSNLQGMTVNGKPAPLEFAVKKLLEMFSQRRDTLRQSVPD